MVTSVHQIGAPLPVDDSQFVESAHSVVVEFVFHVAAAGCTVILKVFTSFPVSSFIAYVKVPEVLSVNSSLYAVLKVPFLTVPLYNE